MNTTDRKTLTLRDRTQVEDLADDIPSVRRDYRRIRLGLETLPEHARRDWELRLNRQLRTRGTEVAALGYLTALVVYGLYVGLVPAATQGTLDALSVGVTLMVGGAAVGKLIGLIMANLALRRSAILLEALLRASGAYGAAAEPGRAPEPSPEDGWARVA